MAIAMTAGLWSQDLVIKTVKSNVIVTEIANPDIKVSKDDMYAVYAQKKGEALSPSSYLGTLFVGTVNGKTVELYVTWIGLEDYLEEGYVLYSLGRKYAKTSGGTNDINTTDDKPAKDDKKNKDKTGFALYAMGGMDLLFWEDTTGTGVDSGIFAGGTLGTRAVFSQQFAITALADFTIPFQYSLAADAGILISVNEMIKANLGLGYGYYPIKLDLSNLMTEPTLYLTASFIVVLPESVSVGGISGFEIEAKYDFLLLEVMDWTMSQLQITVNIPVVKVD
jgi:hypothetical protein